MEETENMGDIYESLPRYIPAQIAGTEILFYGL